MRRFHEFLDSLHTDDNDEILHTIVEGLWSIYGNNSSSQDMGGELITEESGTNPNGHSNVQKSIEEISKEKFDEQAEHRLTQLDKAGMGVGKIKK